jgi:hypothetical protein
MLGEQEGTENLQVVEFNMLLWHLVSSYKGMRSVRNL